MRSLSSIGKVLLNVIFPIRCIGCEKPGEVICRSCKNKLQFAEPIPEHWLSACYSYGDKVVRTAITDLKFKNRRSTLGSLIPLAADNLIDFLQEQMIVDTHTFLILVPIPANKTHRHHRGFNQALLIARALSRYIGRSKVKNLLQQTRNTAPQSSIKNKDERLKNMDGAFSARKIKRRDAVIILIDDIITTGASMKAARKALEQAGYQSIYGFTLAYTPLSKNSTKD